MITGLTYTRKEKDNVSISLITCCDRRACQRRRPVSGKETGMEEKDTKNTQEDPVPLTDEEFAEYQKKENRKTGIIMTIIDLILEFFR